jgi:hypothetical protein
MHLIPSAPDSATGTSRHCTTIQTFTFRNSSDFSIISERFQLPPPACF